MSIHIALLRAVNLGGKTMVPMAGLRAMFTDLGFTGVRTLLQSGNVLFQGDEPAESALEAEAARHFPVQPAFFLRTAAELAAILDRNPFPGEARTDPGHLVVVFLKTAPTADAVASLRAAVKGREIIRADGRQLYVTYPDGIGRSRLTNVLVGKKARHSRHGPQLEHRSQAGPPRRRLIAAMGNRRSPGKNPFPPAAFRL